MSLIEQASRRLEELRRAGSQVAGDLSGMPADDGERGQADKPSIIERAVSRLETSAPVSSSYATSSAAGSGAATADSAAMVGELSEQAGRLEPRIRPASESRPARHAATQRPSAQSAVVLDFALLGSRGYLTPEDPEGGLANQFRKVKWPLIQACQGRTQVPVVNANRILVTSSVPGEGKSFVALNLALSIAAERDHSVLLIDADTTRPSLSNLLGISARPGLLDLLAGKGLEAEDAILQTNVEKLEVLGTGPRRPHATELLASDAMEALVAALATRRTDRILIFDAPPLLAAPEPAVLATHMGQIVLVAEAERTTHATLKSALAAVETCPVVRMVLNKASSHNERYTYAG